MCIKRESEGGGGWPHPLFPQVFYLKFFIWDSENHSKISPQEQIKKRNATHYASTSCEHEQFLIFPKSLTAVTKKTLIPSTCLYIYMGHHLLFYLRLLKLL